MKHVVVASNNPVKKQAALAGFQKMFAHEDFKIEGIAVPSGVSDQPMSDEETLQGALNRAQKAAQRKLRWSARKTSDSPTAPSPPPPATDRQTPPGVRSGNAPPLSGSAGPGPVGPVEPGP